MAQVITAEYYAGMLVARIINFIVGVIDFMLGVRVLFELFGANPASPFIAWVYNVTVGLVSPFARAFPTFFIGTAGFVDTAAILAMIVYAVIGWLAVSACYALFA